MRQPPPEPSRRTPRCAAEPRRCAGRRWRAPRSARAETPAARSRGTTGRRRCRCRRCHRLARRARAARAEERDLIGRLHRVADVAQGRARPRRALGRTQHDAGGPLVALGDEVPAAARARVAPGEEVEVVPVGQQEVEGQGDQPQLVRIAAFTKDARTSASVNGRMPSPRSRQSGMRVRVPDAFSTTPRDGLGLRLCGVVCRCGLLRHPPPRSRMRNPKPNAMKNISTP